jgi:hypothetical protein
MATRSLGKILTLQREDIENRKQNIPSAAKAGFA